MSELKTWQRTKTPGLLKHRSGLYYARLRIGGKPKFIPLETDIGEVARSRFAEHKLRSEQGRKAASRATSGAATMGDYLTLYRASVAEDSQLGERTRTRYLELTAYIEKTWAGFAGLRPDEISVESVKTWRNKALTEGTGWKPPGSKGPPRKGGTPATFNKALETLKRLLDIAVTRGAIASNPLRVRARGKDKLRAKVKPRKPKIPSRQQLEALFSAIAAGPEIGGWAVEASDFLRGLAYTGARVGEASNLTWANIDFAKGSISVPGTKTDAAARTIPMNSAARALLMRIRERREQRAMEAINGKPYVPETQPVFSVKEAQKSLDRACKEIGIERLTHHDFRDVFATTCIEAGVDIPTVAGWLGHADGGALLMKTYNDLRNAHSVAQAARVNFT